MAPDGPQLDPPLCALEFELETVFSPIFLGGLAGSAFLLAALAGADQRAANEERTHDYDHLRRRNVLRTAIRIRIGPRSIMLLGWGGPARFLSPTFLLTAVMAE